MIKRQKKTNLEKRTKDHSMHRTAAAAILLILSVELMAASVKIPAFAEWYSETIYPFLVNTAGRIMGTAPFSVAELCLYLLLAALVFRSDPGSGNSGISLYCRMRDQLSQAQFFGGGRDRDVFLQL